MNSLSQMKINIQFALPKKEMVKGKHQSVLKKINYRKFKLVFLPLLLKQRVKRIILPILKLQHVLLFKNYHIEISMVIILLIMMKIKNQP